MRELAKIEQILGYTFSDKQLLIRALTHSTYANLHGGEDNERLEYLGDSVLQLIVTERQYLFDSDGEGEMTKRRQRAVCEEALLAAVETMGLPAFLRYEGKEQNVGKKTLSSLYESVLAAIYLDGGMVAAKAFADRYPTGKRAERNYKGELQEYLQSKGLPVPTYTDETREEGFESVVEAEGRQGRGKAGSKRAAEQLAAKALLQQLKG